MLTVRLFAVLRERQGSDTLTVERLEGESVGSLYARLFGDLRDEAGRPLPVLYAVDEEYVDADVVPDDGATVAFIPPLGGGGDPRVRLTEDELDEAAVAELVAGPERGGLCTFSGTVRDHDGGRRVVRLEYEAYPAMAEKQMSVLCDAIEAEWPGVAIAMHHRIGTLEIGETAVVVAAAAPHRDAAFAACRAGIDRLKERVPIWKKEVYADGSTWKANAGSSPDASPGDAGQPPATDGPVTTAQVPDSEFGRIPGRLRDAFSSKRGRSEVNPFVERIHEFSPWVLPGEDAPALRGGWRAAIGVAEDAPLVLEIGTGNGFFFRDLSSQRPDAAFAGVEIRFKRVWMTARKALDAGARNFRVVHQSFGYLDTYFAEGELDEVWINHPDPWPKDRHHKHRLLQPSFAALLASRVRPGGLVQVQSDFAPYGPLARSVFGTEMWEHVAFTADLWGAEDTEAALLREGHIQTNYEKKKVAQGEPIMIARVRRTEAPARPPTEAEDAAARRSVTG